MPVIIISIDDQSYEIFIYICKCSSYDERILRIQSAQYRKRRAMTVKVTLTSARCGTLCFTYVDDDDDLQTGE